MFAAHTKHNIINRAWVEEGQAAWYQRISSLRGAAWHTSPLLMQYSGSPKTCGTGDPTEEGPHHDEGAARGM